MQTTTNNTTHTTLNQLVYEPVPPIDPSNPENQAAINPINPPGNLADQAGPVLITRKIQPIYSLFDKYKSDAHQLLQEGKITEASEIYISLAENRELKLKKRLICALKLLEINAQTLKTAQAKEYTVKAVDLLIEIAKDDRVHGLSRLKAFRSLTETKGLEEKALEVFETFFKSQTLLDWIQDAARNCIAPILFAKAQNPKIWPLDRIEAAKMLSQLSGQEDKAAAAWASIAQYTDTTMVFVEDRIEAAENLSKIKGYEERAAELLIAIAERPNDYSAYRIKASEILAKLNGYSERGNNLIDAFSVQEFVEGNLPKRIKLAQKLSAKSGAEARAGEAWLFIAKDSERYVSNRTYAAEMLSKIPWQEDAERKIVNGYLFEISDESKYFKW